MTGSVEPREPLKPPFRFEDLVISNNRGAEKEVHRETWRAKLEAHAQQDIDVLQAHSSGEEIACELARMIHDHFFLQIRRRLTPIVLALHSVCKSGKFSPASSEGNLVLPAFCEARRGLDEIRELTRFEKIFEAKREGEDASAKSG